MAEAFYYVGEAITIQNTFYLVDGVTPADPTTVTLAVKTPDGVTSYLTPLVNPSVGVYQYSYTITQSGVHTYVFTGSGAIVAVEVGTFTAVNPLSTASPEYPTIYPSSQPKKRPNSMPLEYFRQLMRYHPYHFWQLANAKAEVSSQCNTLVKEHTYMDADRVGRSEIRDAIMTAEKMIAPYLGYLPYPKWTEEIIEFPKTPDAGWYNYIPLEAKHGNIIETGVETLDIISEDEEPTFTAEYNSSGLLDTFTIAFTPGTLYDEDDIAVYINEAYWVNLYQKRSDYKIEPLEVSVNQTTTEITITGSIWLIVKPELYEDIEGGRIDPDDTDNFVDSLDVYKVSSSSGTTYDTCEAVLIWDERPANFIEGALCCPTPGITYTFGQLGIRNAEQGLLSVGQAVYNSDAGSWVSYNQWWTKCRLPDRAIVRYYSGADKTTEYLSMIARLAAAELTRGICACDSANRWLYEWQFDLARIDGANDEAYRITDADLGNPFGTRRGHVDTWRKINSKKILHGIAI